MGEQINLTVFVRGQSWILNWPRATQLIELVAQCSYMVLSSDVEVTCYNNDSECGSEAGPSKKAKLTYKFSFSVVL